MHPGVSWGDLGYPVVSWGNQTDPFDLVQVIAFTKICYIFVAGGPPPWAPVVAGGMWIDPFCLRGVRGIKSPRAV